MWQRCTVVAGENHERVLLEAASGEEIEHLLEGPIEPVDFGAVIRELLAHPRQIRPVSGKFERGGVGPIRGRRIPGMMWVAEVYPETKRFLGRLPVEKLGH